MTPTRWQQIERLLDQALDLHPDQRPAFLDLYCPGDAELRGELEALLAAEDHAPAFLEEDAVAFAAPALGETFHALADVVVEPGQRLGAYRLRREIAHGGMSVVFLAERDDGQFQQQVAVKLLRHLGGARDERLRRFRAERQILASLHHPNIAQVLDGGVTEGGWPYLVMEYVAGVALTDYCRGEHLSLDERLVLFEAVCRAVEHAHRRLIVHRDLKPSNILVTGEGTVKLLDFGIAKLLDEEMSLLSAVPETGTGMRLLTPQYAAPEQVRGEAVTTATDVYALGILLYEVLTGRRPYEVSGKAPSEIERIVCEQEPLRPSTAVTEAGQALVSSFPTAPSRWHQALRGDLDTIVLKALRKEPEERYGSAQDLAEDVRRYREGLPVAARPSTVGYRVRKFVRRHRVGAVITGGGVLLVIAFAVVMAWQQAATARERDRARVEAVKAREVTDFMLGLFSANEPGAAPTDTITARTLLARGEARAQALRDQPEVQAEMLGVVGRAYRTLGRSDRAEPLVREALTLQRKHLGADHPSVAQSLSLLGALRHDLGDYAAADSLHREALALRRRRFGEHHADVASSLNDIGRAQQFQGNLAAADSLTRLALGLARDLLGAEHPETIAIQNNVAVIRGSQGNFAAAESLQREVLALRRRVLGENHIEVAENLNNLGYLLTRQGRFEAAEPFYREALAMKRNLLGEVHPDVARALGNLATLKGRSGDYEAAEPLLQEVLVLWRRLYGDRHPSVATAMNNLAVLTAMKGDHTAAAALHRQVLALRRDLLGDAHPDVAGSLYNLASELTHLGPYAEAERLHREALAILRALYGEAHPDIAEGMDALALIKHRQGAYAEAERLYRESLALWRSMVGEEHPDVAFTLRALGATLREKGDYTEADSLLRAALTMQRALLTGEHPHIAQTLDDLGILSIRTGALAEAATLLDEALELRRTRLGASHPDTRATLEHLIDLYDAWDKPGKAAEYRALLGE